LPTHFNVNLLPCNFTSLLYALHIQQPEEFEVFGGFFWWISPYCWKRNGDISHVHTNNQLKFWDCKAVCPIFWMTWSRLTCIWFFNCGIISNLLTYYTSLFFREEVHLFLSPDPNVSISDSWNIPSSVQLL
jgi:hypothetical protein